MTLFEQEDHNDYLKPKRGSSFFNNNNVEYEWW